MNSHNDAPVKLRPEVAGVNAYRQGIKAPEHGFKLSSNENPFDPLPSVLKKVQSADQFNRYADATMQPLRGMLAERFGVTENEVHIASGSVAILYQLVHASAGIGDEYIFPWPSFEAYPALGLSPGAKPVPVELTSDQRHDLDAMVDAITDRTRAILLCTPNNPTGPALSVPEFERFMDRVPDDVLVVLDEAYREFITKDDAVKGEEVLKRYPQLVVLRTFSKAYGLAGLRIGYAVGNEQILNAARSVSIPLSLTETAHAGAVASLEAEDELANRVAELVVRRDDLAAALAELGYDVSEAQGNFVWLTLGEQSDAFADFFAQDGIVVRAFPGYGVRISIGEPESIPRVKALASRFISDHMK